MTKENFTCESWCVLMSLWVYNLNCSVSAYQKREREKKNERERET